MTNKTLVRSALAGALVLALSAAPGAWAQQKQKLTYKTSAADSTYPQRHVIEVGDQPGHTVGVFEIHRKFGADGPSINGVKFKESWTRGYTDYLDNNGLSVNYTTIVMENGDRFTTNTSTMGQADSAGKRSTVGVGRVISSTGKLAGMRGMVRNKGASDGKAGFNESSTELEYWFDK